MCIRDRCVCVWERERERELAREREPKLVHIEHPLTHRCSLWRWCVGSGEVYTWQQLQLSQMLFSLAWPSAWVEEPSYKLVAQLLWCQPALAGLTGHTCLQFDPSTRRCQRKDLVKVAKRLPSLQTLETCQILWSVHSPPYWFCPHLLRLTSLPSSWDLMSCFTISATVIIMRSAWEACGPVYTHTIYALIGAIEQATHKYLPFFWFLPINANGALGVYHRKHAAFNNIG